MDICSTNFSSLFSNVNEPWNHIKIWDENLMCAYHSSSTRNSTIDCSKVNQCYRNRASNEHSRLLYSTGLQMLFAKFYSGISFFQKIVFGKLFSDFLICKGELSDYLQYTADAHGLLIMFQIIWIHRYRRTMNPIKTLNCYKIVGAFATY